MRLHTNIFLWIFIATVLPLTVLAFVATTYVQNRYEDQVYRQLHVNLNNMAAEIRRHFDNERSILLALSRSDELHDFDSALLAIGKGQLPADYPRKYRRLTHFLDSFSRIQPGVHTIRVLDAGGNTLVKVSEGHSFDHTLDSLSGMPYVEQEVSNDAVVEQLKNLPDGEVANLLLPQRNSGQDLQRVIPMLDHLVALEDGNWRVGYLSVSTEGESVDRILDYASRPHDGRLLLAELNPDDPDRNGMILYSDADSTHLAQLRYSAHYLQKIDAGRVWHSIGDNNEGGVLLDRGRRALHYIEFQPYRNTLVSWLLAINVDTAAVAGPFRQIRIGIWILIAVALLISLVITRIGSRRIADPVCQLAENLKQYADGKSDVRVLPEGTQEIRQLGSSFNYMADTLDQAREERDRAQAMMLQTTKLASVGEMAAGIGHEINNPLNNILSYAKLIDRGLGEGQVGLKQDLASLREEAMRASDIVRGILNFSRQMPTSFNPFAARTWLEETLGLVQRQAERREVRLMSECPADMTLYGDRGLLQQVLVNLLLNAIQASEPGQRVDVRLSKEGSEDIIEVADEGRGISPQDMERVFDPFFTTKLVGEGSGLGLSISLGIVEQHGGSIHLKNLGGGGVQVTIRLPQQAEANHGR